MTTTKTPLVGCEMSHVAARRLRRTVRRRAVLVSVAAYVARHLPLVAGVLLAVAWLVPFRVVSAAGGTAHHGWMARAAATATVVVVVAAAVAYWWRQVRRMEAWEQDRWSAARPSSPADGALRLHMRHKVVSSRRGRAVLPAPLVEYAQLCAADGFATLGAAAQYAKVWSGRPADEAVLRLLDDADDAYREVDAIAWRAEEGWAATTGGSVWSRADVPSAPAAARAVRRRAASKVAAGVRSELADAR